MKSLIGKNWVDSSNGETIQVMNPATNELVDTVPSLTVEDVNKAVDEAYASQKEWEATPLLERCKCLMKFKDLV
jgi:succinate-semialdehyde dehydrogenase/glutarate-semialdehyde dehydrogenase